MIRFYFDENVREAVAIELRKRAVDVIQAKEDGYNKTADETIVQRAHQLGRVLVSHDEDMLIIARKYQNQANEFSGVIYAIWNRVSIGSMIEDLFLIATFETPENYLNRVEFLPL